jgi:hypothetical protein
MRGIDCSLCDEQMLDLHLCLSASATQTCYSEAEEDFGFFNEKF